MGIIMAPEALVPLQTELGLWLPEAAARSLNVLLESGMAAGTLCATVLNLILPQWKDGEGSPGDHHPLPEL
jgi:xanthine/uracil permease